MISKNELERFIKFKRYIFSYKRKTLKKILKKYNIENNFNLDLRAENLNICDLIKIFRAINSEFIYKLCKIYKSESFNLSDEIIFMI